MKIIRYSIPSCTVLIFFSSSKSFCQQKSTAILSSIFYCLKNCKNNVLRNSDIQQSFSTQVVSPAIQYCVWRLWYIHSVLPCLSYHVHFLFNMTVVLIPGSYQMFEICIRQWIEHLKQKFRNIISMDKSIIILQD